jgi:glycosyltransferase involved in cell wall biosynthesis
VAIAQDWMVQYAGSERVVEEMLHVFPDADLLTSVANAEALPSELRRARTSLLQRLPGAISHHEYLLPLMPLAWRLRTRLEDLDAVISSSHACAKAVRAEHGTPHLCYCHTPMRYAWDFDAEAGRFPRASRPLARAMMAWFRRWDRSTASRVTRFVANSRAVADRISRFYGRTAEVVPPPVKTDFFCPNGVEQGEDFLYVGRLVSYKRADLAVAAFADLPYRLVVVGDGHMGPALRARATPNVTFLGKVDDDRLRDLYRRSRALVFPADEDFGITMAEAQACGTPVISFARGGALDIVEHETTGWLMQRQHVDDLRAAVRRAAAEPLDRAAIRARAERFSAEAFRGRVRDAVESMVLDPRAR